MMEHRKAIHLPDVLLDELRRFCFERRSRLRAISMSGQTMRYIIFCGGWTAEDQIRIGTAYGEPDGEPLISRMFGVPVRLDSSVTFGKYSAYETIPQWTGVQLVRL